MHEGVEKIYRFRSTINGNENWVAYPETYASTEEEARAIINEIMNDPFEGKNGEIGYMDKIELICVEDIDLGESV